MQPTCRTMCRYISYHICITSTSGCNQRRTFYVIQKHCNLNSIWTKLNNANDHITLLVTTSHCKYIYYTATIARNSNWWQEFCTLPQLQGKSQSCYITRSLLRIGETAVISPHPGAKMYFFCFSHDRRNLQCPEHRRSAAQMYKETIFTTKKDEIGA